MNSQFHTPSLGDEAFDLSGIDVPGDMQNVSSSHSDNMESKRIRSMDQSLSSPGVNLNDFNGYAVAGTNGGSATGGSGSGILNITAHLNNNINNNNTSSTQQAPMTPTTTLAARKQLAPSTTDPNEPTKPLSPYALFFRDTVSTIKQENPNCSFPELSRIVSSMWEVLDPVQKDVYNKRTETARNEYLQQMRIYRQQQQQQQSQIDSKNMSAAAKNGSNINVVSSPNVINANNCVPSPYQQELKTAETTTTATLQSQTIDSTTTATDTMLLETEPANQQSSQTQASAPQQIQMLTEAAGSAQLCIRDGCNKRAIVNPDWEDEYCSNECVVIHCRNVFNDWVQTQKEEAKLELVKQEMQDAGTVSTANV